MKYKKSKKSNFNLELNKYLNNCDSTDVIAFDSNDTFHIRKLLALVSSALDDGITNRIADSITHKLERKCNADLWFKDGEQCEILKAGSSGWQTGKIKLKVNLTLEFIPDEPKEIESPLDKLRQEINNNNP